MVGSSARLAPSSAVWVIGHEHRLARERHTWSDSPTNPFPVPTASLKHKTNYVWAEDDRVVHTTCREIAPSTLTPPPSRYITCDDDIDPTRHT